MNDNVEKIDLNRVDWKSSREFFESLGEALDKLEDKDESYDFTWVGKRKSIIEAGAPINKILRPDVEASKDFDNTKNMLIVGDNLDALKLLQESYLGKIKMIYIDPPYNTGHDFVYHDNFTVKKVDFEDGSTDSDGNVIISEDEYAENSKANGRFHSDWLSMMYPRLRLARNLLTDDGVIFISIDDNEQANLKKLCDEVFGEDNFITQIPRLTSAQRSGQEQYMNVSHDYVMCYVKNHNYDFNNIITRDLTNKTILKDKNGRYIKGDTKAILAAITQGYSKGGDYDFEYNGKKYSPVTKDGTRNRWLWSKDRMQAAADLGILVETGSTLRMQLYLDKRFDEKTNSLVDKDEKLIFHTADFMKSEYANANGSLGLKKAFDGCDIFSNPKPIRLIEDLIRLNTSSSKEDIILDFFSGSGTTGHAAMDLNAEDGGKRQYICVQLDEKTDEKSEAKKAGYDTIEQITAERLRRAGEKIKSEHPEADIDTGFRVFRVDGSNNNENIRKPLGEIDQSDMFDMIDNVKKDRTPLDLLFGIIYTSALPFDLKLETRKIGENTVYMYGYLDENTGLIACFDDEVPEETVKEIAKLNPLTAAFKDSSFKNSAEKINLSEHFRIISPDTRVKVI